MTTKQIDKLIVFLNKYTGLTTGHMVDFYTQNLYNLCIPDELQQEISDIGYASTVEMIINKTPHPKTPQLNEFITTAKGFSLYNYSECLKLEDFRVKLQNLCNEDVFGLKLDVFMKSKKSHEVETLSEVAVSIAKIAKTSHLVDIGDGKGYLSSLLSFHHKLPVLGVDASQVNTNGAVLRARKLERMWDKVVKIPTEKDDAKGLLYKQVTQLVTEETNFDELVGDVFMEKPDGLGLVGLHTCGNLGPSSIRIFNANKYIKSICNVSCCYHLINEDYLANSLVSADVEKQVGFPMSQYLVGKCVNLPRSARMLSSQSIDRILANQELPNKIIFYRAIFEVVLRDFCKINRQKNVGRYKRVPENFVEYSRVAFKKVGVDCDITDDELEEYYEKFKSERVKLNVFHLIRSMLAPAIEALLLLDRYLFLQEQGQKNVFLVQLFDPVISPRCYGLIAYKS